VGTSPSNEPVGQGRPYRSTLADHPTVSEVLPLFVARLANYVQQLRGALAEQNADELKRLLHQLKGAGKSYGFGPITDQCSMLEQMLVDGLAAQQVQPQVQALIDYLEHVDGYVPPGGVRR